MTLMVFCKNILAETLTDVYQKELAFLLAQKRTMQKQIVKQQREYRGKIERAKRKVKALQDRLVNLTTLNETSVNRLADAERQLEMAEMNKNLVNTTVSQGLVSLNIAEKSLKPNDDPRLIIFFDKAFSILKKDLKDT